MSQNGTPVESLVYRVSNQLDSRTITTDGPWGCTTTLSFGPTGTCNSCGQLIGPRTTVTYLEPEASSAEGAPAADSP
jgi:hypothetical protein